MADKKPTLDYSSPQPARGRLTLRKALTDFGWMALLLIGWLAVFWLVIFFLSST